MTRLFATFAHSTRYALVCTTLFCIAVYFLTGLVPCAHAQEATTDAQQEATALLREAARRTAGIRTVYATFTQEKFLSILDAPLISSGYLCLERMHTGENTEASASANTSSSNDRVLWAYEKPSPSGFAQEDGHSWLWAGEGASRRRAEGPEAVALKTITAQIMAWIRIRPDELARAYRMERVYTQSNEAALPHGQSPTHLANQALSQAGDRAPVVRLIPRQSGAFFSALEVTLNPTLETIRQLRFLEKNGDSTVLTFHDTRVNAVMPAQCRPPNQLQ